MGLESGNYVSDLVATNPPGTDPKSQGDDHLRLIKSVLKQSFPTVNGALTAEMVPFAPGGTIAAANVQAAIGELDSETQGSFGVMVPQGTPEFGSVRFPGGLQICWNVATTDPDGNAGISFQRPFSQVPAVTVSAYGGTNIVANDAAWMGNCNSLTVNGCQVSGRYAPVLGAPIIPSVWPVHVIAIGFWA